MKKETKRDIIDIVLDTISGGLLGAGACAALCTFGGEKYKTNSLSELSKPIKVGFTYGAVVGGLGSTAAVGARKIRCRRRKK